MKRPLLLLAGIAGVLIVHTAARIGAGVAMAGATTGQVAAPSAPADPSAATAPDPAAAIVLLALVVLVSVAEGSVIAWFAARSRAGLLRTGAAMIALVFCTMTVQPQVEALYFGVLAWSEVRPIVLMGAAVALITATAAALLLARRQPATQASQRHPASWLWRFGLAAIAYVAIYLVAGYFIAWINPAVREYYGGSGLSPFWTHIAALATDHTGLLAVQASRGVLWGALALLVAHALARPRWETALITAALFAVLMNAQLLLPNPLMPWPVRRIHLLETVPSNAAIGALAAWLLAPHRLRPPHAP